MSGPDLDDRRWMPDLGALLALPSLWVDHSAAEIADGLLGVLVGMLGLDAAIARFDGPGEGESLTAWRPTGQDAPRVLEDALASARSATGPAAAQGVTSTAVRTSGTAPEPDEIMKVATLRLALPWGEGIVAVSARRAAFPTERETHLLRVAVGQAAIALHTARRLADEQGARRAAERELDEQRRVLQSLLEDLGPALTAATARLRDVSRGSAPAGQAPIAPSPFSRVPVGQSPTDATRGRPALAPFAAQDAQSVPRASNALPVSLTRRELEVLGLLAQGLSNKEMAGVLWLSDRTIERHITSLYRKIGVGRRSEATAFAVRHGIA